MRAPLPTLIIVALGVIFTSSCQQNSQSPLTQTEPACEVSQEDYAVFSAVLNGLARPEDPVEAQTLKGKELVILAKTQAPLDRKWEFSSSPFPNQATEADFRAKAEQSCLMRGTLDTLQPSRLLSEEEAISLFKPPDPWSTFYKRFPNATGIISFAQPGYSSDRTEALVALSHSCGGLCGVGRLYLLTKVNGKWVIQNRHDVWIS